MRQIVFITLFSVGIWAGVVCSAHAVPESSNLEIDIVRTDIEDLLNMTVTTASKVPEKLQQTAAPVFVLSSEDIRRSGATSVPEVLRLVPGVQVARVDANKWAVSIRGFNARATNKLLVMIDGRTIYDPFFSGVLWETRDLPLENIERIEVIRGPGGSTWGANAVNGVINIITKRAQDTQGGLIVAGGGSEERGFSTVRYGGKISDTTAYRIHSRYLNRDQGYLPEGSEDDAYFGHSGFRVDSDVDSDTTFMMSGVYTRGDHDGPTASTDFADHSGNLQAAWEQKVSERSTFSIQSFYDRTDIDTALFGEKRNTFEIDAQHHFAPADYYDFVYGATYRYTSDDIRGSEFIEFVPKEQTDHLGGFFFENRLRPREDLNIEFGAKFEYNERSHFDVQPSVGTSWTVSERNVLWASVGRAVRTPSRLEEDLEISIPGVGAAFIGNRGLEAETLIAYDAGYRTSLAESVLLDFAVFYNVYDDLVTIENLTTGNGGEGNTYGGEASSTWQPSEQWQLQTAYTYLRMDLELDDNSIADPASIENSERNNPQHQLSVRSSYDLTNRWELDAGVRYVDTLNVDVPSYFVADVRVAWDATDDLELSVVGQNLFDKRHFEQSESSSQVQHGVYGRLAWSF